MTKRPYGQKKLFGKKSIKNAFEQNFLWYPEPDSNFLANIIVTLMAPVFQIRLKFIPEILNYGRFSFLKLGNAVSRKPKKHFFHCFLTQNYIFALNIANRYDKQLTLSESWDWDRFFQPGFEVSSNSNHRALIFTTSWHSNQGEYFDRLICIIMYLCICICLYFFLMLSTMHSEHCTVHTVHCTVQKGKFSFLCICICELLYSCHRPCSA